MAVPDVFCSATLRCYFRHCATDVRASVCGRHSSCGVPLTFNAALTGKNILPAENNFSN